MVHVGGGEVRHVDVEVDEEGVRPALQRKQGLPRGRGRIRADASQRVLRHPRTLQGLALGRVDEAGVLVVTEEDDVLFGQERPSGPDPGELARAATENVGQDHPVEDPRGRRIGSVEVHVSVEIQQAETRSIPEQARDDPETDGAVASQHERQSAIPEGAVDAIRRLPGHVCDEVGVLLPWVLGVGAVGDGGQVAEIGDVETVRPQAFQQAGGAEGGGRSLLSGSARAGTRGDADQADWRRGHGSGTRRPAERLRADAVEARRPFTPLSSSRASRRPSRHPGRAEACPGPTASMPPTSGEPR